VTDAPTEQLAHRRVQGMEPSTAYRWWVGIVLLLVCATAAFVWRRRSRPERVDRKLAGGLIRKASSRHPRKGGARKTQRSPSRQYG
jgi:hypothetical protein